MPLGRAGVTVLEGVEAEALGVVLEGEAALGALAEGRATTLPEREAEGADEPGRVATEGLCEDLAAGAEERLGELTEGRPAPAEELLLGAADGATDVEGLLTEEEERLGDDVEGRDTEAPERLWEETEGLLERVGALLREMEDDEDVLCPADEDLLTEPLEREAPPDDAERPAEEDAGPPPPLD